MTNIKKLIEDNKWRSVKELDFVKINDDDTEILGLYIDGAYQYYSIARILYLCDDGSPYWWDGERTGIEVKQYRPLPIDDRLAGVCELQHSTIMQCRNMLSYYTKYEDVEGVKLPDEVNKHLHYIYNVLEDALKQTEEMAGKHETHI